MLILRLRSRLCQKYSIVKVLALAITIALVSEIFSVKVLELAIALVLTSLV